MGSSGNRVSASSYPIVVDDRSYRSTSTSSYSTMSSRGSSSGAGSDSYNPYSSNVTQEQYRSSKSGNFQVNVHHRSHNDRGVSIYNHNGSGYEQNAPHPPYSSTDGRNDSGRTSSSRSSRR
ncbi:hypothetical protein GGS26DRAFT_578584 [Hypomontagnella submonticulosa]|nr:hypothetical protein GGS26DRAFT_578584 [Hypomontagnella submonticulosa]